MLTNLYNSQPIRITLGIKPSVCCSWKKNAKVGHSGYCVAVSSKARITWLLSDAMYTNAPPGTLKGSGGEVDLKPANCGSCDLMFWSHWLNRYVNRRCEISSVGFHWRRAVWSLWNAVEARCQPSCCSAKDKKRIIVNKPFRRFLCRFLFIVFACLFVHFVV